MCSDTISCVLMQVPQTVMSSSLDRAIVQQELGLVDIFVSLCRFEWQAGYQELTTALFQAQIEYSLFCPSLLLTEQSKRRLFEYFWDSAGARVGEDGALGWSTWLEKEEEQRQKVINEESSNKIEEGGWTGWSEPLSKRNDIGGNPENILDENMVVEDIDDESEARDIEQEDDTEALLKMLGISADIEADGDVKDTTTWIRWSEEELSRDSDQWMPVRANSGASSTSSIYSLSLLNFILFGSLYIAINLFIYVATIFQCSKLYGYSVDIYADIMVC